jgi:hypothetical protein
MTDKYVYHFTGPFGPGGEIAVSPRAATLEAIQGRGEPVMESQIVVDQTELDCDGFLVRFGSKARSCGVKRRDSRRSESKCSPPNSMAMTR